MSTERADQVAAIVVGAATLAGWASLTTGVQRVVPAAAAAAVWPTSIGLLLLSACGWRYLGRLALRGVWAVLRKQAS